MNKKIDKKVNFPWVKQVSFQYIFFKRTRMCDMCYIPFKRKTCLSRFSRLRYPSTRDVAVLAHFGGVPFWWSVVSVFVCLNRYACVLLSVCAFECMVVSVSICLSICECGWMCVCVWWVCVFGYVCVFYTLRTVLKNNQFE